MTKQTPLLKQQQQSHSAGGVAADANFLESVDVNQVSSVVDLHRSNLLRIQTQELVEACTISPDKQWVKIASEYMNHVSDLIGGMELADHLSELPPAPFPTRLSDRHTFDFSGLAEALQVEPLSRPFLGLSTPSGNALVLPTFTLRVLLPPSLLEPKDHLRNRYFDVSLWEIASMFCISSRFSHPDHSFSLRVCVEAQPSRVGSGAVSGAARRRGGRCPLGLRPE